MLTVVRWFCNFTTATTFVFVRGNLHESGHWRVYIGPFSNFLPDPAGMFLDILRTLMDGERHKRGEEWICTIQQ